MLHSMARPPLHTLPTFRTVARLANLRAAAEELHLTHSAVSQQIRLLEEQIGFALFDRRGRRIVLNAAGAALLRSVEPALEQIDDGLRAAAAAAAVGEHTLRVTVLPSFAQRWWLPRMASWRERHPDIGIELHTSQQLVDLQRDGFHAAVRTGPGPWRGLECERLFEMPLIALGSPNAARRLLGQPARAFADEPLLGDAPTWERWFALAGERIKVRPVAEFNDAGMLLQAAEQDLGIALARAVFAADALREGRLYRLSPIEVNYENAYAYWLCWPPALRDWPPLRALRRWLVDELQRSLSALNAAPAPLSPPGTAPAGPTGSRSRAASAPRAKRRA
ncbi:MAG: LysR family transcriptional regulator [Piscinibacter sp.]|uniref:LysR substrate-binding domain-containing protein n=1 Tax=Piscinibacter sp. TaxID=1903157 RepID=UPI00258A8721|nr:LysR substrate-binding domain-containing protein [Piscinibacter sp.]MCW5666655.1 LysR family transcriptional regulator [Piscinibacter sp.]